MRRVVVVIGWEGVEINIMEEWLWRRIGHEDGWMNIDGDEPMGDSG